MSLTGSGEFVLLIWGEIVYHWTIQRIKTNIHCDTVLYFEVGTMNFAEKNGGSSTGINRQDFN